MTMLSKSVRLLGLLLAFFQASTLYAAAGKIIEAEHRIALGVGEARLIELSQAAKTAFVAEPDVASFQAPDNRKLLVFGRALGNTTLFALDDVGRVIYSAKVSVGYDLDRISKALRQQYPRAKVSLEAGAQGIIVRGSVRSAAQANEIIALISALTPNAAQAQNASDGQSGGAGAEGGQSGGGVGRGQGVGGLKHANVVNLLQVTEPNQVNVRIRIAEVSKDVKDKFEFTWNLTRLKMTDVALSKGNPIFNVFSEVVSSASSAAKGSVDLYTQRTSNALGMVDILAEENLLNILAEPNLTVKSGETASFLAGGELLIPKVGTDGSVDVEEKPYGVLLQVTPTIVDGNKINLHVRPEISDISASNSVTISGSKVPGLDVRSAETTIELGSGQSFALAGMLKSQVVDYVAKIPLLGDIPILGHLFRSHQFQNSETELIMVATVYLVEPSDAELALPTDNEILSTPFERFLFADVLSDEQDIPDAKLSRGLGDFKY